MGYPRLVDALRAADFDNVEVVGLGATGPGFDAGGPGGGVEWSQPLGVEDRGRLRTLISALPAGESAKCHMPPFGLRFGVGPGALRVSICFRCSNAYAAGTLTAFDAESAQAQSFLAFLRACAPSSWKSSE